MTTDKFTEQGIQVFDVDDDMEWWGGHDFEEAFAAALKAWGYAPDSPEAVEAREVSSSSPLDLDATKIDDRDGDGPPKVTPLRAHIQWMIASGMKFPEFVGGRE